MIAPATAAEPILLVDQPSAARMLSVDPRTVRRLTEPHGDLPCVRIGTGKRPLVRYRVADLEAWIARLCNGGRKADDNGLRIVPLLEGRSRPNTTNAEI